jgi:hypothetical protein
MSDKTREALRKMAQALRKAGGIAEPPVAPNSTGSTPPSPTPNAPNRRAEPLAPGTADQKRATLGVVNPPLDGNPRALP